MNNRSSQQPKEDKSTTGLPFQALSFLLPEPQLLESALQSQNQNLNPDNLSPKSLVSKEQDEKGKEYQSQQQSTTTTTTITPGTTGEAGGSTSAITSLQKTSSSLFVANAPVIIVAFTASDRQEDRKKALQAGYWQ